MKYSILVQVEASPRMLQDIRKSLTTVAEQYSNPRVILIAAAASEEEFAGGDD